MKENKLYKLTTVGLGDFYVIATTTLQAEETLIDMLNIADYGFPKQRKIRVIEFIANEIHEFPEGKPFFSANDNLIICKP